MTRKPYAVDLTFWPDGNLEVKTRWIMADVISRKILETSDSFEALCLTVLSKYDPESVSFDKVAGRKDVLETLRSCRIPHLEGANTPEEKYVTYR